MSDTLAVTTRASQPPPVHESADRLGLVGQSETHRALLRQLHLVARTNAEVLISGPTGVGKELYARYLHECSGRRKKPFVPVNCGALPDGLFENELFGHMVGAFTGARADASGLVASAEGGTLFLDEVDTLHPAAQVKLLRLIQEKEYRRLGETFLRRADVRFVSATNSDLHAKVAAGQFREDLFFRLRVIPVHVEPLCRRGDDIELLVGAFLDRFSAKYGLPRVVLSETTWDRLRTYPWPGNIRELENCIHGLICRQIPRTVEPSDLMLLESGRDDRCSCHTPTPAPDLLGRSLREVKREAVGGVEEAYLRSALRATHGNIADAAKIARKNRRAFFELLRKYQIRAADYRPAP